MTDKEPSARPTGSELAKEEAKIVRFLRITGAVVGGAFIGFYVAVRAYDGPSFSMAFAIFGVIGGVVGVLSFVFGRSFWEVLVFLFARRR